MDGTSNSNRVRRRHTEGWTPRILLVLVLALVGSSGCGRHTAQSGAAPESRADIALVVENHHWNDVVVYLQHEGITDRIGLATAVKTSTFIIPSRRLGTAGIVRLRGHAVGAPDDHTTEAFLVRPGQEIQWTLESDLARSSVAVH
jgi:hypothetical protein